MDVLKIEQLSNEWSDYADVVIQFGNIDSVELQRLFRETYYLLDEFSKEKLVPKQISKLLVQMNEFGWWISDLDETPLHKYYQEIIHLITALHKYFLTRDYDVRAIERMIKDI